jgi:hypothetical protein
MIKIYPIWLWRTLRLEELTMQVFNQQTYPQNLWVTGLSILILAFACLSDICRPAWATETERAETFVSFEYRADGKCQILSEGGKLVVLHNTHPDREISYRLVRYFAGVPQARVLGQLKASGTGEALGCSRVDGREQLWKVERASFK